MQTFAACHQAFDGGGLVAIYPEGTTHAKARVQRIKTGAARIALSYEAQAPGCLMVVPVGQAHLRGAQEIPGGASSSPSARLFPSRRTLPSTASSRRRRSTRSRPRSRGRWSASLSISRASIRSGSRAPWRKLCHVVLERELWAERGLPGPQIDPFRLSRSIGDAVAYFRQRDPERGGRLWQRIQGYRALLAAYRLRDEAARSRLEHAPPRRRVARSWQAIAGFPLFAYGAVVNFLPYYLPRWLAPRLARRETDDATIRLLASAVAFPVFWALETLLVGWAAGLGWALAFLLSLPLGGLIAYRHLGGTGRLLRQLRFGALLLTRARGGAAPPRGAPRDHRRAGARHARRPRRHERILNVSQSARNNSASSARA